MKARHSKEDWQELIFHQDKSGLSAQQFCHDDDACPKYFSIRKKQLGLRRQPWCPYCHSSLALLKTLV